MVLHCACILSTELKIQEIVTLTFFKKALQKITGKLNYPAEQIIWLCNCKEIDITLLKTLQGGVSAQIWEP